MKDLKLTTNEFWKIVKNRKDQVYHKDVDTHIALEVATKAFLKELKKDIDDLMRGDEE